MGSKGGIYEEYQFASALLGVVGTGGGAALFSFGEAYVMVG